MFFIPKQKAISSNELNNLFNEFNADETSENISFIDWLKSKSKIEYE